MSQTRMTKQRTVLLETLRGLTSHPTADELYAIVKKKLPRISLGTVYRNLDLLSTSGEIVLLEQAGQQKRFDGNTSPHYHVRCTVCGRVGDIFNAHANLPSVDNIDVDHFTVHSADITFYGVCSQCEAQEQ